MKQDPTAHEAVDRMMDAAVARPKWPRHHHEYRDGSHKLHTRMVCSVDLASELSLASIFIYFLKKEKKKMS